MSKLTSLVSLSSLLLAAACSTTGSDPDPGLSKDDVRALGKADHGRDYCEEFGWYGDDICDDFCLQPDPDCGPVSECPAPDATALLVAIEDGGVVGLDPATGDVEFRTATGPNAFGAIYSPDGSRAFTTDKTAGTLTELDRSTGVVRGSIPVGTTPQQPAITSTGRMYIPLAGEAAVGVVELGYSASQLAVLRKIPIGAGTKPHIVSLSPDGKNLWVTVQGIDPKVVRIEITAGGEGAITEYRYDLVPRVVRATNEGAYFTAHHSTGLHHVALADGKVTTPIMDSFGAGSEARKQIEGVDASPTGAVVAFTHEGRKALVVETRDGTTFEILRDRDGLSAQPYWVTFDPSYELAYVSIPGSGSVEAYDLTGCSDEPLWSAVIGGKPKRMDVTAAN